MSDCAKCGCGMNLSKLNTTNNKRHLEACKWTKKAKGQKSILQYCATPGPTKKLKESPQETE